MYNLFLIIISINKLYDRDYLKATKTHLCLLGFKRKTSPYKIDNQSFENRP